VVSVPSVLGGIRDHCLRHLANPRFPRCCVVKGEQILNKAFLKWAGGKSQLLETILALMPKENSGRFFEPFVGSGVVALNVPHKRIVIADVNPGLIAVWSQLKNEGQSFIDFAEKYFTPAFNTEGMFYEMRSKFNAAFHEDVKAASFLYLNRHCFNGLCRFNAKGEFNVPYGKYAKPYFPKVELEQAMVVATRMEVFEEDFGNIMNMATEGDVVYCDPPYIPLSVTSNFTAYSKGGFGMDEQIRLKDRAERLRDRGATVILSNNDVPLARELYKKADEIHEVQVRKAISCKSDGRKKSGEIIAVYRP
jgi:DNA adenine methylase